jgi:mevalonate kinase
MPRRRPSLRLRSETTGLKSDSAAGRTEDRDTEPSANQQLNASHALPATPSTAHPVILSPGHPLAPARRTSASAAAKLILCGEHAVVYGRPAIALPLAGIRAHADIAGGPSGSGISVYARDLRRRWHVASQPNAPISQLITSVLSYLGEGAGRAPDLHISISSVIPIASGMGSGAAVATAIVRALAAHLGRQLSAADVSSLVYASEQRFHGTPSGIDNTVIAYEQPIWFQRTGDGGWGIGDRKDSFHPPSPIPHPPMIEPITIATPFTLLIGETGVRSATRLPVGEVRRRWQADPARYEALFDQVGAVVAQARAVLEQGDIPALGPLLSQNHTLLQQIGVSSPQLDTLVAAAQSTGALGAKLSGAGWGGVMLALVAPDTRARVAAALEQAGAKRVSASVVDLWWPAPPAL